MGWLWDVTEYLAYVGIIIQTTFLLMSYFGFKVPDGDKAMDGYLDKAANFVGKLVKQIDVPEQPTALRRRRN